MLVLTTSILVGLLLSIYMPLNGVSFPSRKGWWTRRITNDFHTAGRLSQRQIKYASEVGFKSILSVFNFPEDGVFGDEYLPSSSESVNIAGIAGISLTVLPVETENLVSSSVLNLFSLSVDSLQTPILVTCIHSYYATLYTLVYLVKTNPDFESQDIIDIGHSLGHDYTQPAILQLIATETGDNVTISTSEFSSSPLLNYWLAKPIESNWYISGQTYKQHIPMIESAGYKAIINLRKGVQGGTHNEPSQEEVTLLNIHDRTGTYSGSGRQSASKLLQSRIDDNLPNTYISEVSLNNYEGMNTGEFGDNIGYNETIEHEYIIGNTGLYYYHLPVVYTIASLCHCTILVIVQPENLVSVQQKQYKYLNTIMGIDQIRWVYEPVLVHYRTGYRSGEYEPVLVHCRTGYRSAVFTVAIAGYLDCKDSDWALRKAHQLGYYFTADATPTEYNFIKDILDDNLNPLCSSTSPMLLGSSISTVTMVAIENILDIDCGTVVMMNYIIFVITGVLSLILF
ncbi:uncharacterized protein LOC144363583 [Saccoglossus kowalevskii]